MSVSFNPAPGSPATTLLPSLAATSLPSSLLPSAMLPPTSPFELYASKLGYPEHLIKTAISTLGPDADTEDLLEHVISLHQMLCPGLTAVRRRRDATHLPRYMLVQDSFYKGKERMPFWVWVKRETIQTDSSSPHRRAGKRTSSSSTTSSL